MREIYGHARARRIDARANAHLNFCASLKQNEVQCVGLAVSITHDVRRRGRAVAASPPHLEDHGSRKSMKIKGGTNASENFSADRFETDGAETQRLSQNSRVGKNFAPGFDMARFDEAGK